MPPPTAAAYSSRLGCFDPSSSACDYINADATATAIYAQSQWQCVAWLITSIVLYFPFIYLRPSNGSQVLLVFKFLLMDRSIDGWPEDLCTEEETHSHFWCKKKKICSLNVSKRVTVRLRSFVGSYWMMEMDASIRIEGWAKNLNVLHCHWHGSWRGREDEDCVFCRVLGPPPLLLLPSSKDLFLLIMDLYIFLYFLFNPLYTPIRVWGLERHRGLCGLGKFVFLLLKKDFLCF